MDTENVRASFVRIVCLNAMGECVAVFRHCISPGKHDNTRDNIIMAIRLLPASQRYPVVHRDLVYSTVFATIKCVAYPVKMMFL